MNEKGPSENCFNINQNYRPVGLAQVVEHLNEDSADPGSNLAGSSFLIVRPPKMTHKGAKMRVNFDKKI